MTVRVWGTGFWAPGPFCATLADMDLRDITGRLIGPRQCRFPVGDAPETPSVAAEQLFCGDAAEPACPYCTRHRSAAWKGVSVADDLANPAATTRRAA
jgi:hypothetical protein